MSSKYSQRMLRLSGKIFGEYRKPEIPPEIQKDRIYKNDVRDAFHSFHYRNENVIRRLSSLPLDLDSERNPNYYPPHPQHTQLISTLRYMGLFRDEHLDFKHEMNRQRALRGKVSKRREKPTQESE